MLQYKWSGKWSTYAPALASVLWAWLNEHWDDLANALGGTPTLVIVVPSRSVPMPTPLYRIAEMLPKLEGLLSPAIDYDSSAVERSWKRKSLEPDAFRVSRDVAGERVLLLEDTWVTGSTPLSTAIAVRRAGATSLALVPIARMVYEDAMTDAYRAAAFAPIDFAPFPR
jgi:predicted amidophosphoribosyltransferase